MQAGDAVEASFFPVGRLPAAAIRVYSWFLIPLLKVTLFKTLALQNGIAEPSIHLRKTADNLASYKKGLIFLRHHL